MPATVRPRGWRIRRPTPVPGLEALTADGDEVDTKTVEDLWREQPHLRTVVDFLARNVAQLGIHAFERDGDDGRKRLRGTDHPVARILARPNPDTTLHELVYAIVASLALYDRAILWVTGGADDPEMRWIPEPWVVETTGSSPFRTGGFVIAPDGETRIEVPAEDVIVLHGWNPADLRVGSSPVDALRAILREQQHAAVFREQLWRNGGRVGTYLSRPKDSPEWTDTTRERFKRSWKAAYTGNGKKVGGVPLLEDGMELKRIGFSAKDEDYVEGTKLALSTVASVYQVNPTMVGVLDNANYSNVKEFRRMLYGDTLGPILAMIEARLNAFLVPRFAGADDVYVEFNLREKLEGNFDEQNASLATALTTGYMTVNEVRAKLNLPAVPGGDELLAPLNTAPIEPPTHEEVTADAA
ncbi:MAG: phage portal protein [Gordonia paraffinivorans]